MKHKDKIRVLRGFLNKDPEWENAIIIGKWRDNNQSGPTVQFQDNTIQDIPRHNIKPIPKGETMTPQITETEQPDQYAVVKLSRYQSSITTKDGTTLTIPDNCTLTTTYGCGKSAIPKGTTRRIQSLTVDDGFAFAQIIFQGRLTSVPFSHLKKGETK